MFQMLIYHEFEAEFMHICSQQLALIKDGQTWKRGLFLREPLNPDVQVFYQTLVSDDQSCLDNVAQYLL
jgi:hypothetical protein